MSKSASVPRFHNPNSRYKTALCLRENINGFIQDYGQDYCGLLSLVFPRPVRWKEADASIVRAQRTLFDRLFNAWICVVELHKDGRPHFHFLVASDENLAAGFGRDARDLARDIHLDARAQHRKMTEAENVLHRRCIRNSTADAHGLRAVWDELCSKLPHYGFTHQHPGTLEPVFSATAIEKYLSKSFGDAALPRPPEMKGAHLVRYSRGLNRRAYQRFANNGPAGQLRRRQIAPIAAVLGIQDGGFAAVYGRHWHYRLMDVIEYLRFQSGRDDGEPRWSAALIREATEKYLVR